MQLRSSPPLHLTYCLNAHAGETWEAVFEAIRTHALKVRARVAPDRPFGLGLRLSSQAALALEQEEALLEFLDFLRQNNLYVFTINGFPYGTFHNAPVKTSVYTPDWLARERLDYTARLARILARLLPDGVDGSISTLPLSYKSWIVPESHAPILARQLADLALVLHDIRLRTGREIHVGLEPEPDCFLGTPEECVDFFQDTLWTQGAAHAGQRGRCSSAQALEILRRHIGICLDTCHMAVEFLAPADALRQIAAAGIRLSKLQISAALETRGTTEALARLRDFSDPVYLHQTRIRDARGIRRYPDLGIALASEEPDSLALWRTHFHVPLDRRDVADLRTTAPLLDEAFWRLALESRVPHWEIETYTYTVLPPDLFPTGADESIVREFAWVLERVDKNPGKPHP